MSTINKGRVFLGGVVAGAVTLAIQYAGMFIALKRIKQVAQTAGWALPEITPAFQLKWAVLVLFIGGPLAIWLYAAIRPRFGAGPWTAVRSAFYLWLVLGPYYGTLLSLMGLLPPVPLAAQLFNYIAALPLMIIAMLAGAWIYKEE